MAPRSTTTDADGVHGPHVETVEHEYVLRVLLHGECDFSRVPELDQALRNITLDGARPVHLDLTHLAFAETFVGNYDQASALSEQAVRYAERAQDEAAIASARVSWARSGAGYEDVASRARIGRISGTSMSSGPSCGIWRRFIHRRHRRAG